MHTKCRHGPVSGGSSRAWDAPGAVDSEPAFPAVTLNSPICPWVMGEKVIPQVGTPEAVSHRTCGRCPAPDG